MPKNSNSGSDHGNIYCKQCGTIDRAKISGGEWLALGADVIFLGLDVVAAGEIIKAVKVAKVANTEAKAANNVMDEYVSTPENAGMPNAVKRESRDNLILSY